MYEKQLTRSAELEQELSDLPTLKQQLENCRDSLAKFRALNLTSGGDVSKLNDLEKKLEKSETEKQSMKQKLDEAHRELQEIVKGVQQAEAAAMASMQAMTDPMEVTKYK